MSQRAHIHRRRGISVDGVRVRPRARPEKKLAAFLAAAGRISAVPDWR